MRRVFVDTGAFFALLVADDRNHLRAREVFELASRERWQLATTNAVVTETYALLLVRSREGRDRAVAFLDALPRTRCRVERVRAGDEALAVTLVRAHRDKTYSLCDACSFTVMERLGIVEAISFDRHFREYGKFTVL